MLSKKGMQAIHEEEEGDTLKGLEEVFGPLEDEHKYSWLD